MLNIYRIFILSVLMSLFFINAEAQGNYFSSIDSLSLDGSIRYGRLPNGFTYYIKSLPGAGPKVNSRLVSRAGTNQEDDDQFDLSHAVEHLAFKATQNFSTGIRNSSRLLSENNLGKFDFRAINGRRGTTYFFDAPHGAKEAIDIGFLWFRDIINGLKLVEEDINSVRGEIHQELILRNGGGLNDYFTNGRLLDLLFPCEQDPSHFFAHNKGFEPETLRRFYKDWYRPDLMALSVVGRIDDVDDLEERIKKNFSGIRIPEENRKLKDCDAAYFERPPQFFTVERPPDTTKVIQNPDVDISLIFRDPTTKESLSSNIGFKRLILIELLVAVINERFQETTNDVQSLQIGSRYLYTSRGLPPALEVLMELSDHQEKDAIERAIYTLLQILKYGITVQEWENLKQNKLPSLMNISTASSNYWSNGISKHFIDQVAFPTDKQDQIRLWLTKLNREEINGFVSDFLSKRPEDIGIIAPTGHRALSYKEKEVRSWIGDTFKKNVEPYVSPETISWLMDSEDIENLREVDYLDKGTGPSGAREVVLENGVRVILKSYIPASGKKTRINLHGFSLKGANCFSEENYFSVINAPAIVRNAGVNGLNKFQIDQFISNTSIRPGGVVPYIGNKEAGIQTDAEIEDFETMLQLVFLYFSRPNKEPLAFEDWKIREYKAYEDPSYNLAQIDFINEIKTISGESAESSFLGRKFLQGTRKFEGLEKIDFEVAYKAYRELYGSSNDFTFIISGDFDLMSFLPLVQKYLGNLENSSSMTCRSAPEVNNEPLPSGPLFTEIPAPENYRIKNVNYGIRFVQEAPNPYDWKEQIKVETLGEITNHRFWGLRFKKGYSLYMVGVSGKFNHELSRYEVASTFECIPKEFSAIRQEIKEMILEIKSGSISEDEFKQSLQRMLSYYDDRKATVPRVMKQNLYDHYRYGQPWPDPIEVENFIKSLTVEDIIETANRLFQEDNKFEYVMKG